VKRKILRQPLRLALGIIVKYNSYSILNGVNSPMQVFEVTLRLSIASKTVHFVTPVGANVLVGCMDIVGATTLKVVDSELPKSIPLSITASPIYKLCFPMVPSIPSSLASPFPAVSKILNSYVPIDKH